MTANLRFLEFRTLSLTIFLTAVVLFGAPLSHAQSRACVASLSSSKLTDLPASSLLPADFLMAPHDLKKYYRGIRLKSLEELDLGRNYRTPDGIYNFDHIAPFDRLYVALHFAFYRGDGNQSVLLEFLIPESMTSPDGKDDRLSGLIVSRESLQSAGLAQLSPLISRIGLVRNRLSPKSQWTELDRKAFALWSDMAKGRELIQYIVRDAGLESSMIEWLPKEKVLELIKKGLEDR